MLACHFSEISRNSKEAAFDFREVTLFQMKMSKKLHGKPMFSYIPASLSHFSPLVMLFPDLSIFQGACLWTSFFGTPFTHHFRGINILFVAFLLCTSMISHAEGGSQTCLWTNTCVHTHKRKHERSNSDTMLQQIYYICKLAF